MEIHGTQVKTLAEKFGTPIFVYDELRIRENFNKVKRAFSSRYEDFKLYYAIKCNSNPTLAKILIEEGAGIDAASINEIKLAKTLGLSGSDILFSGNFLSDEDIREGIETGVLFNLDDISLLPRLLSFGKPETLSFRINPGIGKSNVGHFDVTGGPDAKFGVHPDQAVEAYKKAMEAGISNFGIHMMGGSCVTEEAYFSEITEKLFDIIGKIKKELGIEFKFVDLGGGLGIPYKPGEKELDLDITAENIIKVIKEKCTEYKMPLPKIMMEPGRYFVADAGYLIGKVHSKKEGYREIWGTDIGMNIVPRVSLYGAFHELIVDGKENMEKKPTLLCGQICEQTDLWWDNLPLPSLEIGDIVIVKNAGAYCYGMSYQYNGRLLPAEILIQTDSSQKIIREAEEFKDMLRGTDFLK